MIDLAVMAKTNENETPVYYGCGYLIEHDWTCDYIGYTGRPRVAIGAKIYPGGGGRVKKQGGSHEY